MSIITHIQKKINRDKKKEKKREKVPSARASMSEMEAFLGTFSK